MSNELTGVPIVDFWILWIRMLHGGFAAARSNADICAQSVGLSRSPVTLMPGSA